MLKTKRKLPLSFRRLRQKLFPDRIPSIARSITFFVSTIFLYSLSTYAQVESPQTFTLDGKFYQSGTTTPLVDPNVNVRVQVLNHDKTCLLYEETQVVDTSGSAGNFSIQIGSAVGDGKRTVNDAGLKMSDVFQNGSLITTGKLLSNPAVPCNNAANVPALVRTIRHFRVYVDPTAGGEEVLTPDMKLESVPSAIVAETIQGLGKSSLLQTSVADNLSQNNLQSIFTGTNFTKLTDLLSGTSSQYVLPSGSNFVPTAPISFNTQRITNVAAPVAGTDAVNKTYADAQIGGRTVSATISTLAGGDAGKVLQWDGAQWTAVVNSATDATKLPLAGGTMTGAITMGGNDILNSGFITMNVDKYLQLSNRAAQPAGLNATHKGVMWYDSVNDVIKYWDGDSAETVGAGGSGVTAIGNFAGASTARGLSISGSDLILHPADGTNPGAVTTGAQTFAGAKTFSGAISFSSIIPTIGNGASIIQDTNVGNNMSFTSNGNTYITSGYGSGGNTNVIIKPSGAGKIGLGVTIPDGSAFVQMDSTVGGLLIPRMTTAQRDAVATPATGLQVYNTTTNAFNYYNGSAWTVVGSGSSPVGAALNSTQIWVGNGSNQAAAVSMSGDAALSNTGVLTIANDAITTVKIDDDAVTTAKILNANVTTAKIADANVTPAKLAAGSGVGRLPVVNGTNTAFDWLACAADQTVNWNITTGFVCETDYTFGTGDLLVARQGAGAAAGAQIRLQSNSGTHNVILKAPDGLAADLTLRFPATAGSTGDVLTTNGSGVLSWSAVSSGGITTVDTFDATSTANGLSISGANIKLHAADGTNPGAVTTGAQTIAGAKTFTGAGSFTAAGTGLAVTNNATVGGTLGVTSNLTVDTNTLHVDATNNRVGVGTASPTSALDVSYSSSTDARGISSHSAFPGWGGQFMATSAQGTLGAPTYPTSGDTLGSYATGGRNGGATYRSGFLAFYAGSNHTGANYETHADLNIAANNSTTPTSVMSWRANGNVGIGTTPVATAILDIASTTKGLLIPRMTEAQRDAIASPATGLQVYNTTTNALNYYNGTIWTALSAGGGVSTAGNFAGASTAKGLSISGSDVILHPADATNPGAVTTGAQTFAGAKTFNGAVNMGSTLTVDTNTLHVDATNNRVAVGTTTPSYLMDIHFNSTGSTFPASNPMSASHSDVAFRMNNANTSAGAFTSYVMRVGSLDSAIHTVFAGAADQGRMLFSIEDIEALTIKNNGNIGVNNPTPVDSAVLDIASTTKGLLIPRMTEAQRDAIGTPAAGLQVYNTTTNALNYFNGTAWTALSSGGAFTVVGSTLNSARIWVGDGSNDAQEVAVSGDAALSNTGALTIANDAVTSVKINAGAVTTAKIADANVTPAKLAAGSGAGRFPIVNGTNTAFDWLACAADQTVNWDITLGFICETSYTFGTGDLLVARQGAGAAAGAQIRLQSNSGTNSVILKAPDGLAADLTLRFPATAGSTGDVLTTNGSGVLSWSAVSSGGVTTVDTFDTTSTANGLSISGANIKLHAADGTNPGAVTTGAQTIAGAKTFSGAGTFSAAGTGLAVTNNATVGGTLGITSNLTVDTDTLFVDATNNRVGIGNVAPSHLLHVNAATGSHLANFSTTTGPASFGVTSGNASAAGMTFGSALNWEIGSVSNNFYITQSADINSLSSASNFVITSGGAVGIGNNSPDSDALLDLTSTTKGLLIPRMTTAQRDAITTPTTGLQVYNTTTNALNYFNGTAWTGLATGSGGAGDVLIGGNTVGSTMVLGTNSDHALDFETNGTPRMTISNLGNVAIGTTPNLTQKLSVARNDGGASIVASADLTSVSNSASMTGLRASASNNSASTGLTLRAMQADVYAGTGGSVADMSALFLESTAEAGTITKQSGIDLTVSSDVAGSVTDKYGLDIKMYDGLNVTNNKALSISFSQWAGAITNRYGIFIDSPDTSGGTVTNDFALYQESASQKNYFAGSVGVGNASPDVSSLVDIVSTTKGILIPRMTTAQRDAIATPATGLQVYNTTTNALNYYNGTAWTGLATGSGGAGDFLANGSVPMTGTLKMGGQAIYGNSTASGNLTLESTSDATKGYVNLQPNGGNVGIGTTTPADKLSMHAADEDIRLRIMNTDSTTQRYPGVFVVNVMGAGNHNGSPSFTGVQTRGTAGVTAPVQSGDYLFQLGGRGVYDNGWNSRPNAQIGMTATETHSGSAGGAAITFDTVANGTTNLQTRMRIDHDGRVGIGISSPSTKAILDLTSTTLGLLIPRMTTAERDAITSPATGLQVYNTTTNKLNFHNGTSWLEVGGASGALTGIDSITGTTALTVQAGATGNLTLQSQAAGSNVLLQAGSGAGVVQANSPIYINNSTSSTSTSSGALVVNGGAGIAGNAYVGGNVVATGRFVGSVPADADALTALTVDFTSTNMVRASAAAADCGTLNFTNVAAGGSYTVTLLNATKTCTTIHLNGATTNVKLPSGYGAGGAVVAGVVYTAIYDGTTLWVSYVPF